jgi:methylated-DNA-protein-cysteine methyltransferase related protein
MSPVKSAAFARIKRDVYAIAASIPKGKLSTFADIGAFLDVVPRQVAFLLALKNDEARESTPWYRVVADDGSLGTPKRDAYGRSQAELLQAEGVPVAADHRVTDLAKRRVKLTIKGTGVRPTPRA